MALPEATFSPSDVVIGHTSLIQLIHPTGPTTTNLKVKVLDYDGENELLRIVFPDTNGVKRTRKVVRVGSKEMLKVETREWKKVVTLLGGKLTDAIEFTSAQLWVRDHDDASGSVALKTDAFACSVYRESGSNRFAAEGGDDAGTTVTLVIESLKDGDITITNDATA